MTIWDFCSNTHIKVVPKEEREKGEENIFEDIIAENFPNLEKDIQIQEAQTVTNRTNPKIATSKYIVIKMAKIKDKENIKSCKGKSTSYIQGNSIKAISWLAEILQARSEWHDIFKVINGENLQSKNTLPGKTFIQIWEDHKFYRQAKTRREQHQQTNFTRNVKETFLTKKEKITNRNIKLWIKKSHW